MPHSAPLDKGGPKHGHPRRRRGCIIAVNVSFVDRVEAFHPSSGHLGVTFATRRGHYSVPSQPEDILHSLQGSLRTGALIRVLVERDSHIIIDVTVP